MQTLLILAAVSVNGDVEIMDEWINPTRDEIIACVQQVDENHFCEALPQFDEVQDEYHN